jgi:hypothetical protein
LLTDVATVGYNLDDSGFAAGAKRVVSYLKGIASEADKSVRATDRLETELTKLNKMPAKKAAFYDGWDGTASKATGAVKGLYLQLAALAAMAGGAGLFAGFIKQGVRFNAEIQTSKLGIASLVASLSELRNADGVQLKGVSALMAALPQATEQIKQLRVAGLATAASTRELVSAFQSSLAPGLTAGLNLDQIRQLTVDVVQAATALSVPLAEIGQEVRAIVSGNIDGDARVAKALGLTNQMVANWKQQNKLAEELNKRLAVFRASGSEIAKTFAGVTSNFKEALEVISGEASSKLTDTIATRLDKVVKSLIDTKQLGLTPEIQKLADVIDRNLVGATEKAFNAVDALIEKLRDFGRREQEIDQIGASFGALTDQVSNFGGLIYRVVSNGGTLNGLKVIDLLVKSVAFDFALLQDAVETFGRIALAVLENVSYGITRGLQWTLDKLGISFQGLNNEVARIAKNLDELEQRRQQGYFKNTRELAESLREREQEVEFQFKRRQADPNARLFFGDTDFVAPPSGSSAKITSLPKPKATGKATADLLREQRQIEEARLSMQRSARENELKLLEDSLRRQQDLLDYNYEQGLVGARAYYRERAALATQSVEAELANLVRLASETQKQMYQAKAGTPERIRLEESLNDALTQQTLKRLALLDIQTKLNRELEKTVKLAMQASVENARGLVRELIDKTPDPVALINDPLARGRRERERYQLFDLQLRIQEEQIQNAIVTGVYTETQGRRALLDVQSRYKDRLLQSLEAQKRFAEMEPDTLKRQTATAELSREIEQLKALGVELNNTQRFLRGLGDEFTTGDFYENFGVGLRDTITQAFEDGFAGAGQSFTRLLKRLAAELLTSELIKKLRNLFNPQATSATSSVATPGGGSVANTVTSALTGGGFGGYLTPSFSGAPIPGVSSATRPRRVSDMVNSISNPQSGGLRGLLSRIPGLSRLFGPRSAITAGVPSGSGPLSTVTAAQAGIPTTLSTDTALAKAAGAGTVGTMASLGASGLLVGGGMLGQLAGGGSQVGQLMGSIGGSLGLGALGATGIFGGGIQAALPALFSNPITAVVAAGLIGGALLMNYLGGREFRKFRKTVKDTYEVDVKGDKTGKGVYEEVKKLGETIYGKGKFKDNVLPTIKTDQAKQIIGAYAEATGQNNSKLVKELLEIRELQDPSNAANRFVRRQYGGSVTAGMRVFDAGSGPEVFVPETNGYVFPQDAFFDRLTAVLSSRTSAAPARASNAPTAGERMMMALLSEVRDALAGLQAVPYGHVVVQGLKDSPREATQTLTQAYRSNPSSQRELLRGEAL